METAVVAKAEVTITKEDIVNHEVENIMAPIRVELDKANGELQTASNAQRKAIDARNNAMVAAYEDLSRNDKELKAIEAAYAKVKCSVSVSSNFDSSKDDGKQLNGYLYIGCSCNTVWRAYPTPKPIMKLVDAATAAMLEHNKAEDKVNKLARTCNPSAIAALKNDFMGQLMSSAIGQINGDLKSLIPHKAKV